MTSSRIFAPTLLFSLFVVGTPGIARADARTAEDTVRNYLKAMQDHKFSEAYDFVSTTLRGGKSREEWAKEQQYIVEVGEVKIFDFKVFPAEMVGEKARVPNILKSQDKYLNQLGLDEYELYDVIKEEGEWRIDQQTLVEGADREDYFPDEKVQPTPPAKATEPAAAPSAEKVTATPEH
jgi:hypothetical protein